MPAYIAMSQEQFAYLDTTQEAVTRFAVPLFIAAAVFMAINMAYSLYKNMLTIDYNSRIAIGLYRIMFIAAIVAPIFPISFGLTGPAPVAISLYWFANSFWTMAQFIGISKLLDRHYPLTNEYVKFRDARKRTAAPGSGANAPTNGASAVANCSCFSCRTASPTAARQSKSHRGLGV